MRLPSPPSATRPATRRALPPAGTLTALALVACLVASPTVLAQAAAGTAPEVKAQQGPEHQEVQRLLRENQPAQALKMADDYLARKPGEPNMRFRRGVALTMLDRRTEALAVFEKLTEEFPSMPAPYNNIAVLYGSMGEYDKSRDALERAIRTNPTYATAYENLGDVYAQLASQAYNKALQLDRNGSPTLQPKLSLLRELVAPAGSTEVAGAAGKPGTVVAAAPRPAPAPAPAPAVAAPPPPAPAAPKPAPAPAPTPAATPAPAPAASPAPAPAPAPAARPDAEVADIEAAVRAWAGAWSARDMRDYFAAYTADFSGQAGSRKAWEADRRARIETRKNIKVSVNDLRISVSGDRAEARFTQTYASDSLDVTARKTLELVRSGGKWLIRRESVGG